jgi:hypothetical protein
MPSLRPSCDVEATRCCRTTGRTARVIRTLGQRLANGVEHCGLEALERRVVGRRVPIIPDRGRVVRPFLIFRIFVLDLFFRMVFSPAIPAHRGRPPGTDRRRSRERRLRAGLDHPRTRVASQPACRTEVKCRGGAPRGRARLRHWRAEHPRKGVPVLPRFPPRAFRPSRPGRKRGSTTGAAFRTSALAALHSLALRRSIAWRSSFEGRGT